MASTLNRLTDGTIELTLTIPWSDIQAAYEADLAKHIAEAELPGFRKGKAPRDMVEAKLDKSHLYSHGLQEILPQVYADAVKEHSLKPILYPKISVKSGKDGEEWVFTALTCELPTVTLPDYTTAIPKLKANSKGAEVSKEDKLPTILDYLARESKVTLPNLLVEEEANHRMAALAENLTNLGMTTDKYLATKKLSLEDHKAGLANQARAELGLELTLAQIQTDKKHKTRQETLDFLTALV